MEEELTQEDQDNETTNQESLQEQEKPLETKMREAEQPYKRKQQQVEHNRMKLSTIPQQDSMTKESTQGTMPDKQSDGTNTGDIQDTQIGRAKEGNDATSNASTEDQKQPEMDKEAQDQRGKQAATEGSMEDRGQQADNGPQILTELWQKHHNQWLNTVMHNSIGEKKPLEIPDFHAHIPVLRPGPDLDINVAPVKTYVTRYDLQIKVEAGENQVELLHQAFCKCFLKL